MNTAIIRQAALLVLNHHPHHQEEEVMEDLEVLSWPVHLQLEKYLPVPFQHLLQGDMAEKHLHQVEYTIHHPTIQNNNNRKLQHHHCKIIIDQVHLIIQTEDHQLLVLHHVGIFPQAMEPQQEFHTTPSTIPPIPIIRNKGMIQLVPP